jgi:hypothetical protein
MTRRINLRGRIEILKEVQVRTSSILQLKGNRLTSRACKSCNRIRVTRRHIRHTKINLYLRCIREGFRATSWRLQLQKPYGPITTEAECRCLELILCREQKDQRALLVCRAGEEIKVED